jgi:hypothetical protein
MPAGHFKIISHNKPQPIRPVFIEKLAYLIPAKTAKFISNQYPIDWLKISQTGLFLFSSAP